MTSDGGRPPGSRCPFCGGGAASLVRTFSLARLLSLYEERLGIRFSDGVRRRYTACHTTSLLECVDCGLQFFWPMEPGGSDFYEEISRSPAYYLSTRWEFSLVRDQLRSSCSVLEVGCGAGSFLQMVRPLVGTAIGLELNRGAAERARASGLDVRIADLHDFAAEHAGRFDGVCAFQLLEHLPAPDRSFGALVRAVRVGGSLFVSVPNRERLIPPGEDPADCPPHHVTRWASAQLERLGRRFEVDVVGIAFEPPDMSQVRAHLRERVREVTDRLPGRRHETLEWWSGAVIARLLCPAWFHRLSARRGWLQRLRLCGHTMLAHYVKVGHRDLAARTLLERRGAGDGD